MTIVVYWIEKKMRQHQDQPVYVASDCMDSVNVLS